MNAEIPHKDYRIHSNCWAWLTLADASPVSVTGTTENGSAARAGIIAGDKIIKVCVCVCVYCLFITNTMYVHMYSVVE